MIGAVVLTLVVLVVLARMTGGAEGWFTWRRYARQHASLSWRDSRPVEKSLWLLSQGGAPTALPAGRGGASPGYSDRWRRARVDADKRGGP
jgi:hypothetical protein